METDRLVVRRATSDDAAALLGIVGDADNTGYVGPGRPWSREEGAWFLRGYPRDDPHLVSSTGLVPLNRG